MSIRAVVAALSAALSVGAVYAAESPAPALNDPRVRFVDYQPDNVVELHAYYGYVIHLVFDRGETIGKEGVVLGDSGSWEQTHEGNNLWIKPKADDATTNMSVLTDRRSYEFSLHASEPPKKVGPADAAFVVAFRYPDEVAKLSAAAQAEEQERTEIAAQMAAAQNAPAKNYNYYAEGSADIVPNKAWDDGNFTYLRYLGGRDLPAVFLVNSDGSEALVNSHIAGDTIVVHQLAAHFVVRNGGIAACIYNKSYDPSHGGSKTGTITPHVQRGVVGANP